MKLTLTPVTEATLELAAAGLKGDETDENITRIELALARVVVVNTGEQVVAAGVTGTFTNTTTWTLDHTLPYVPHVSAVDAAGRLLRCAIDHISTTRVAATHNAAQSGTLRIS